MNVKKLLSDHSGVGHLKGMAVLVGGVFIALVLMGKPAGDAIVFALFLACPLMMVGMMFGGHQGHGSDEHAAHTREGAESGPRAGTRSGRTITSRTLPR